MNDTASTHTCITHEMLNQSNDILQRIMNVCNACKMQNIAFSEACRAQELNPVNTKRLILRLDNCMNFKTPLKDNEEITIFDGYETFYRAIFGDKTIEQSALPVDYKESVVYVLKETGLRERESDVLMRHFGIVDYEVSQPLRDISDALDVSLGRIQTIELNALRKCRCRMCADILMMGLEAYNQKTRQKKEEHEQKLKQQQEEHEALMAKRNMEHRERMNIIESNTFDKAVEKLLPDTLPKELKEKSIRVLDLSVRPYNALARGGKNTLYDVLAMKGFDDFVKLRNMGDRSAKETEKKFDEYVYKNYGISAQRLRAILINKEGEEKDEKKSAGNN